MESFKNQRTIWQIYGQDAREMTLRLLTASDAARLVPPGGTVALKPNLVLTSRPEQGAVTHPGVLAGCVEYFRERGAKEICVIEGSWIGDDTSRAMKAAGYDKICAKYDVPFYDLKKDKVRTVRTAIGDMKICVKALDAGLLVNLPVLKGHCQTRMTCALKNLKGCVPDVEKRRFHALGLTKPIAALGAALHPGLTIVDSICGDLSFEEGGSPVQTNRMFLGTDPVQIDAYGRSLMGFSSADVPYVELAEEYGAGSARWSESDLATLNEPTETATYPKPSGNVAKLTRDVRARNACSACFASLVRALYVSGRGRNQKIYIGQGWRGEELDGLGIGACCRGATRCVQGCPPTADAIAKALDG